MIAQYVESPNIIMLSAAIRKQKPETDVSDTMNKEPNVTLHRASTTLIFFVGGGVQILGNF